jgi:hypothetical protein
LNKASMQVGILELVNAAKHAGGPGAHKKAVEIGQQMRQEMGGQGNLKRGEQGKEFKRRLKEAGLLPDKGAPSEKNKKTKNTETEILKAQRDKLISLAAKAGKGEAAVAMIKEVKKIQERLDDKSEAKDDHVAMLQEALGSKRNPNVGSDISALKKEANAQFMQARMEYAKIAKQQQELIKEGKIDEAMKLNGQLKPIAERVKKLDAAMDGPLKPITASRKTRIARNDATTFDKELDSKTLDKVGDTVNWKESKESGSKTLGQGSFGTVIQTPDGKVAHKRGDIGEEEAALIKKVGEAGIGPKLIGAELNGPGISGRGTRLGRLAMDVVKGEPLGERRPDSELHGRNASDIYWETRAAVHRLGIQHNDLHHNNVMVGEDGKGKIIDLGLAMDSPRAALSEALGAFSPISTIGRRGDGDWQVKRWNVTGSRLLDNYESGALSYSQLEKKAPLLAKIVQNKEKVVKELRDSGFSTEDINKLMTTEIRKGKNGYSDGPFARISDVQALRLINTLYEGV